MHDTQHALETVYLWLGQPSDADEHLLMVLVDDPDAGPVYRPLMAVTEADAHGFAPLAQDAATALGVTAVLRRYEVRTEFGAPETMSTVGPRS